MIPKEMTENTQNNGLHALIYVEGKAIVLGRSRYVAPEVSTQVEELAPSGYGKLGAGRLGK